MPLPSTRGIVVVTGFKAYRLDCRIPFVAFGLATFNKIGQNKEKFIYKIYKNKTNNYFIILITYYEIATADLWNAAFWWKMTEFWLAKKLGKAKRAIFPRKWSSRNDTKTPGTGKSLLSPRKYSWRLVAFVEAWEWAREKVNIFHLGQKWCAQK